VFNCTSQCNDTLSATSATTTSVRIGNPHLSMIQQAFQQQSGELGWDNFLCGRISSRWRVAAYDERRVLHQRIDQHCWAANLVKAVLNYSHSLWTFWCEVLRGRSQSETVAKHLLSLQQQVHQAYEAFHNNPFIVRHHIRYIFSAPLSQRLQHDADSLQCFLKTYQLAIQEQTAHLKREAEVARRFFLPKNLPKSVMVSDRSTALSPLDSFDLDLSSEDALSYNEDTDSMSTDAVSDKGLSNYELSSVLSPSTSVHSMSDC
jgi:hypothetical protein